VPFTGLRVLDAGLNVPPGRVADFNRCVSILQPCGVVWLTPCVSILLTYSPFDAGGRTVAKFKNVNVHRDPVSYTFEVALTTYLNAGWAKW